MSSHALPIVAIVGRPNVGKSTLFNRYTGANRALVEDTPGVTRDSIAEEVDLDSRRILLVDTAGLDTDAESALATAVQAQAQAAIEQAEAILFVVDGKSGLLPEDETIANTLRRSSKPIALVVNKIDLPKHYERVHEFHRLGFKKIFAVSGTHGTGAFEALEALIDDLPQACEEPTIEDGALRIAIVGRPNVGKSSLVNRLVGAERVVVSDEPGTTRDSVDIRIERDGESFVLVDTAGIRRSAKRTALVEHGSALMTLRAIERADVVLIVIDGAEGFSEQDARVAGLVRDRGRAAAILVNKNDLLTKKDLGEADYLRGGIERGLRFMADTPMLFISAKTGARVEKIFALVKKLNQNTHVEISTARLNRWLEKATHQHEPSLGQAGIHKRPIKFFYATQATTNPPTFILFCTDPAAVKENYRRYLENRLREEFDLHGIPIRLRLRARTQTKKRARTDGDDKF